MGRYFVPLVLVAGLVGVGLPARAEHSAAREDARIAGARPASYVVKPSAHADRIIVRYRSGADAATRSSARARAGVARVRGLAVPGWEVVEPRGGETVDAAAARLRSDGRVADAIPDLIVWPAETVPDDDWFSKQWALHNTGQAYYGSDAGTNGADVDAPQAWDTTTGSETVIVAVVDTGVAYDHTDLDGSALILPGSDWVDDDDDPYDDEALEDPLNGHGSHVAGIIGARGNNGYGVAGLAWNVQLMPLRVLGPGGGPISDIVAAMGYAAQNGARIVNLSLGLQSSSQSVKKLFTDAVEAWPEVLFVAAAGNAAKDVESEPFYPCNVASANLICVAATDADDELASFSNVGETSVDLGAPGHYVLSTSAPGYLTYMSGTSMAAPMVSGAAALLWAQQPSATVAEVRAALLGSGDLLDSLAGTTVTGRRLNVVGALEALLDPPVFEDVSPSDAYYDHVQALYHAEITKGCSSTPRRYCPGRDVDRGQMAVFLIRAMGFADDLQPYRGIFGDVPKSRSDARYIERLFDLGVTHGCQAEPRRYCPDREVTRAQMAVFLTRAESEEAVLPDYQGYFADVPAVIPPRPYIEHLKEEGVTHGCGSQKYCPDRIVTRAQMAVFIARAYALV